MVRKRTLDAFGGASFVTFSCYKRRRWLDHDKAKRIVLGILAQELRLRTGLCMGFVVMPDHVHGLFWFQEPRQLSAFMQMWKRRTSVALKHFGAEMLASFVQKFPASDAVWQKRFYEFNVYTERKVYEKLEYMHYNPVRAGLVREPCAWPWSSARFWELGRSAGVPVRVPCMSASCSQAHPHQSAICVGHPRRKATSQDYWETFVIVCSCTCPEDLPKIPNPFVPVALPVPDEKQVLTLIAALLLLIASRGQARSPALPALFGSGSGLDDLSKKLSDERLPADVQPGDTEEPNDSRDQREFERKHPGSQVSKSGNEIFVRPPGAPGRYAF